MCDLRSFQIISFKNAKDALERLDKNIIVFDRKFKLYLQNMLKNQHKPKIQSENMKRKHNTSTVLLRWYMVFSEASA